MAITRMTVKPNRQKRFGTKSLEQVSAKSEKLIVSLPKGGRQFNKMSSTDKSDYKPETMGNLSKKEIARMRREKSKRDVSFNQGKVKTNFPQK